MKIEFEYLPVVGFAMQQNNVELIRKFVVTNDTETTINNLVLKLKFKPEFAQVLETRIDKIEPNESISVNDVQPVLDSTFFINLTERMEANITLSATQGEEVLFSRNFPISILAFDQWQGIKILPELTAAFVTPNNPAITNIIRRAAEYMKQWTESSALDEYQTQNPNRVRKQMAAIYEAIKEQHIVYITAPASFENEGQRIRTSDAVLTNKLGTCIDMALLYASCLEAIGIHPLIILIKGHAFAGGWLVRDVFPDCVSDDISLITKRTAAGINEIELIETTCMNDGKDTKFDDAVELGKQYLLYPENFECVIDVIRARFANIRPLPQRVATNNGWQVTQNDEEYKPKWWQKNAQNPNEIRQYDLSNLKTKTEITKQDIWERKLLDLSLRNNLLNLRITQNTIQFVSTNIDTIEDALYDGDEFQIYGLSSIWGDSISGSGIQRRVPETEENMNFLRQEIAMKRLRTYLPEENLQYALKNVYRASRLSLEENGANTLYLAIGLMKWFETEKSEKPRFAPILLYPVELIRKSLLRGYVLRARDEDVMLNVTLVEMLRQNFGITIPGLDPLPKDESGVDVKLIFSIVRQAIMKQKGWDIEEQIILGTFSFNKFIMWNDIHTYAPELKKNKIVSSLMDGKMEWQDADDNINAAMLDQKLKPSDLILPVSADSSQLEAIYASKCEKSFVLHGPPGTGKSQTITNIIANALYNGKRVLFVAEKMAALSVVQRRLEQIGIGAFCLELHSNKANKKDVIAQLQATASVLHTKEPDEFAADADKLFALRSELNKYINALHKPHNCGVSLYDAIIGYTEIEEENIIEIPPEKIATISKETFLQWKECADDIKAVCTICGHPHDHPLNGININNFDFETQEKLKKSIDNYISESENLTKQNESCKKIFDCSNEPTREQYEIIYNILKIFVDIPAYSKELLQTEGIGEKRATISDVIAHGRLRDEERAKIETNFISDFLNCPAEMWLQEWKTINLTWAIPRFFKKNSFKKRLKTYAKANIKFNDEKIVATLESLRNYKQQKASVDAEREYLSKTFGDKAIADKEQWNDIEKIYNGAEQLELLYIKYDKDRQTIQKLKDNIAEQMIGGFEIFRHQNSDVFRNYIESHEHFATAEKNLEQSANANLENLYGKDNLISTAETTTNLWRNNIDKLKNWYRWLELYRKACSCGFDFAANDYATRNLPTERIPSIFLKGFYKSLAEYIIIKEPELQLFNGDLFNNEIEKFRNLDKVFRGLVKRELYAKLAANVPDFSKSVFQNSEVGILQRNIRNNGRGTSIRKLFDSIPNLLERMCPCMLMSPISVAQYINIEREPFDLIIFDEASQMPTSEAVGTIARGKSLIVVGDPKQMPPTSFFESTSVDEDHLEIEDLDSILDDCLALTMPSKFLLWHYRSKHESLISFSNSQYYNNKLLTFPSPDNLKSKVKFVSVNGFYDKGKTRQNKAEAEYIVKEIMRRLNDPILRRRSIGVVTFSSVQQTLIEDMLADELIKDTALELAATQGDEPIFVKNLENVQGDERDVILFSVCYGPDSKGNVSHNFGPLNREGGERRLNVAVSRARYEMIVFSTLSADMIDLNRTAAVGVAGLKNFLEYAEKGVCPEIMKNKTPNMRDKDIADIIADALRDKGLNVDTHIGSSGFKIDIGIIDSKNQSRYILGILCDGDNYYHTQTARDREITQNEVLRLLGWNIYKIWTLDWWENKEKVIASIFDAITEAQKKPDFVKTEDNMNKADIIIDYQPEKVEKQEIKIEEKHNSQNTESDIIKKYKIAQVPILGTTADAFMLPKNKSNIEKQIKTIIVAEAPISQTLLIKKLISAWGISKAGVRIMRYFNDIMSQLPYYKQNCDDIAFYWKNDEDCETYATFRPESDRNAADIAPQEVANAILYILQQQISLNLPDLIKATAQQFGFARTSTDIESSMRRGIELLKSKDKIKIDNGKVVIK